MNDFELPEIKPLPRRSREPQSPLQTRPAAATDNPVSLFSDARVGPRGYTAERFITERFVAEGCVTERFADRRVLEERVETRRAADQRRSQSHDQRFVQDRFVEDRFTDPAPAARRDDAMLRHAASLRFDQPAGLRSNPSGNPSTLSKMLERAYHLQQDPAQTPPRMQQAPPAQAAAPGDPYRRPRPAGHALLIAKPGASGASLVRDPLTRPNVPPRTEGAVKRRGISPTPGELAPHPSAPYIPGNSPLTPSQRLSQGRRLELQDRHGRNQYVTYTDDPTKLR